ncbi:MAG: hypothetical protein Ct9H300mP28_14680 [Pseudomonadota bacterium]|nr:MAG: hypothetical protein Ct9H300mP28_14680 [Pseudomonadota bacterium]
MSGNPGFWTDVLLKMENSAFVKIKLYAGMTATGKEGGILSKLYLSLI